MADLTKQELEQKISKYRSLGEDELADKYQKELNKLSSGSIASTPAQGDIVLQMTPEEFEKASSKFAAPGLHNCVFGMPAWKQVGKSLEFPYVLIEDEDADKTGSIYCGVSKDAAWKIKEILKALNVQYKSANGLVSFNPAEVAGKQASILYTQVQDTRTVDEGGKGTIYTKPAENNSVFPYNATLESIGVTMNSLLLNNVQ